MDWTDWVDIELDTGRNKPVKINVPGGKQVSNSYVKRFMENIAILKLLKNLREM